MSHHHHHHHHHGTDGQSVKRIRLAFVLNLIFAIVELIGGMLTQSMAIVADAIHDFGDSLSLGLALILEKRADKKATQGVTYGYRRLSAVSAFIVGIVLLLGSIIILWESVPRILNNSNEIPDFKGMFALACFGIAVNGYTAWKLSKGSNQNERVLSLHLLEDLLGWVAVLIGSILIFFFKWPWLDPLLAACISAYIIWNVLRSLASTIKIFLQYVPESVDLKAIQDEVEALPEIRKLRDYHAWTLDGSTHVFSCTIELVSQENEDYWCVKTKIREILSPYGFRHITIEMAREDEQGCHNQELNLVKP
ncbi:cation diffusion facilitator family transporter [Pseudobacteriovorax antillogorgiicola]|uniref:Cobalt-zinc-cadmium efflux system protein n=1 Tax=Pseudobacteriovorax antillogorgiicola TaxID=1513793 RepID=A0A1Y6CNC5_9BACT|nr:cation diffusion facilitator family transporter [Pseudobacteriovorax antillogorgiicola]TCS47247.1 cobalt-zinc-cadmium efflux system protein [Pseudobacteriovorax antillogorgiicola]SMF62022.1 cobalt-zinc-cadmium efflux system protein [Pseudobacteriovorax antillogorgiicola]